MAFSSTDVDALDSALASGELMVRFPDGRSVQYRSVAELKEARTLISAALANATSTRPCRQLRINVSKGI